MYKMRQDQQLSVSPGLSVGGKLSTACLHSSLCRMVEVRGRSGSMGTVQPAELPLPRNALTGLLDGPLASSVLLTSDDIVHNLS